MSTTEKIQMKLSDSKSARWTALFIVSVTMMFGYFFTDVMSPLEPLLTAAKGAENGLGLGWSSDEYGFFSGAYGYFNVFLLLLFFGGLILDKFGIRFTGILSTVLMFGGALLKWYAVGHEFAGSMAVPFFGTYSTQVVIAALGFAIYGVGCEICGITVSKVIVKWFTGHELALAMGVQVATARLGTAAAWVLLFLLPRQWAAYLLLLAWVQPCFVPVCWSIWFIAQWIRRRMLQQLLRLLNRKKDSSSPTWVDFSRQQVSGM